MKCRVTVRRQWADVWMLALAILFFVVCIGVLLVTPGCKAAGWPTALSAGAKTPPVGSATDEFAFLNWLGFVFVAVGMAALVASTFIPLIPRKSATTAIVCGVGSVCLKVFLAKFLTPLVWASLALGCIAGFMAIYPWIVGWVNRNIRKRGEKLVADGDVRAGTAIQIAAQPRKFKDSIARKTLLLRNENKAKLKGH